MKRTMDKCDDPGGLAQASCPRSLQNVKDSPYSGIVIPLGSQVHNRSHGTLAGEVATDTDRSLRDGSGDPSNTRGALQVAAGLTAESHAQFRGARVSRLGMRPPALGGERGVGGAIREAATAAALATAAGDAVPPQRPVATATAAAAHDPTISPGDTAYGEDVRTWGLSGGGGGDPRRVDAGLRDRVGFSDGNSGGALWLDGSGVPAGGFGGGDATRQPLPVAEIAWLLGRVGELRTRGRELVARLVKVQDARAQLDQIEEVLQEELQAVRHAVAEELEQLRNQGQLLTSDVAMDAAPSRDTATAAATAMPDVTPAHDCHSSKYLLAADGGMVPRIPSHSEAAFVSLSRSTSYCNPTGAPRETPCQRTSQSSEPNAAYTGVQPSSDMQVQQPQPQRQLPPPPPERHESPQAQPQAQAQEQQLLGEQDSHYNEPAARTAARNSSLAALQLLHSAAACMAPGMQPISPWDGQAALPRQLPGGAAPPPAPARVTSPLLRTDGNARTVEVYGEAAVAATTAVEAAASLHPALGSAIRLLLEAASLTGGLTRQDEHSAPGQPHAQTTAQTAMPDLAGLFRGQHAAASSAAIAAGSSLGGAPSRPVHQLPTPGRPPGQASRPVSAVGWQQGTVAAELVRGSGLTATDTDLQIPIRLHDLNEHQQPTQQLRVPSELPQQQLLILGNDDSMWESPYTQAPSRLPPGGPSFPPHISRRDDAAEPDLTAIQQASAEAASKRRRVGGGSQSV